MSCQDCNCGKKELEEAGYCGSIVTESPPKIAHPIILGIAIGGGLAILMLLLVKHL